MAKIFQLFNKQLDQAETIEFKGAETVHDFGLTDQEATDSKVEPKLRDEALKEKVKSSYKS